MAAGPTGPDPHAAMDPTRPAPQVQAPPPPPPEQRFDRGQPHPQAVDPYARPAHDPNYPQDPNYYGPPAHDRAAEAAAFARRHIRTPETKEFFKTSEFLVWGVTFLAVLIAGAASDTFDGSRIWIAASVLSAAYILSRGIAKAGTSRAEPEGRHWGHDHQS